MTDQLHSWIDELATALGIERGSVDVKLLLDVARDSAHGVARPAAPITTFLVGLAAGRNGGDAGAVRDAAARAQLLLSARQPVEADGS